MRAIPHSLAPRQGGQRGAALISAVFLITALAVLGALMTKLTIISSKESIDEWYSTQALYAAESGADWAAYHIVNNDTCESVGYPYAATIPVATDATVEVAITCTQPGKALPSGGNNVTINLYHITTTGKAGGGRAQRELTLPFIPTL
jgi:Tfp pilus assembly protein PilX